MLEEAKRGRGKERKANIHNYSFIIPFNTYWLNAYYVLGKASGAEI